MNEIVSLISTQGVAVVIIVALMLGAARWLPAVGGFIAEVYKGLKASIDNLSKSLEMISTALQEVPNRTDVISLAEKFKNESETRHQLTRDLVINKLDELSELVKKNL